MTIAISMVKAVPGQEKLVYDLLKKLKGKRCLYHIFGNHDFFLILEAENIGNLAQMIDEVRRFDRVNAVDTVLTGELRYHDEQRCVEVLA
jgi:hypothetical protein